MYKDMILTSGMMGPIQEQQLVVNPWMLRMIRQILLIALIIMGFSKMMGQRCKNTKHCKENMRALGRGALQRYIFIRVLNVFAYLAHHHTN